uniref:nuclear valosin-containing protein-like isoform X1 n=1 Tax=Monopterus albus TaxID=43700 RepID=UPI0009B496B7|nr:nuclear valosin-containing protein-like isoform X1 [Monopterus albus]XP_020463225.1 nuclear valosin-containing protein-like isoform X1 [Monopterus albus]XP_020463226.1 nuclear valosin-containing protein-like isoform X1 [Monopterus albus]XP_020463227.1 nuclear valosin-containing protein-like isoform X1 [Monopterus albus]XP_020463228.1 nuclear valosin-containing protein-like isoform X1 [Monopterus albus]
MKNRGGGSLDIRLRHRVEQYLASSNREYVDLSAMALDVQKLYRLEYGRRNKTAFRIQVEKVYDAIMAESALNDLESKHLAKRAKHSHNDTGEGDSNSEESSDSDDHILENTPTNHMNSSLTSLYRKGNPDSSTCSTRRDQPAASSPVGTANPRPTAGTLVSTGGWFIDRGRDPKRSNVLIDLCDEEPTNGAANQQAGVSRLEPEKSHRKKYSKRTKSSGETAESRTLSKKAKPKSAELQYPTLKFEDVGGNEETLTELCKLLIHMRHPEVYQHLGMVPPRGFLLHGPPGCGKTLLAQAVAGELQLPMLKVSAPELVSGVSGESEQKLRELFDLAVGAAPCILFIDEIDSITPKREVASKDMERRIVAQLLTCMDDLNSLTVTSQVLVIGATNRPDSLDPALRRAGRFDREICLGIPDEAARLRILKTLCRKLKLPEDIDYQQLARLTPGYVGADLMALCREAAMGAVNRVLLEIRGQAQERSQSSTKDVSTSSVQPEVAVAEGEVREQQTTDVNTVSLDESGQSPLQQGELWHLLDLLKSTETLTEEELASLSILMSDFQAALASVQPSAKREGFATVPDVTWEDVGALQDIREELTMAILAPVRSPEQFRALGLSAPSGVLLAGPPGCGKTLLAKAVANESGLNFISVKGPELLNMYVGESERAVRQVFQRGRNSAPCVIFFDEIDALCPRRSGYESGASVRVVNQLLTEMDGLETRRQVFIMAATNRPDIIDPAILRPGRLDKTLYVGLPPPADRHAILLTITKGGTKPQMEHDVRLEEIAFDERCDCFTGADLTALVREASVHALRAFLKHLPADVSGHAHSGSVADIRVSKQNFEDAFKKVHPSVSKKDQRMYEQLRESLGQ